MHIDKPSPILTASFTGLALVGSLFGLAKIPGMGVGWSNVFVPLGGIGLMVLHRKDIGTTFLKYRTLFLLTLAVGLWGWVAALAGWDPALSIRWLIKAGGWTVVFVGATLASRDQEHASALVKTLWLFLILLTLGGVTESIFPNLSLWRVFRTEDSLSIQPRVAGFLGWPNQFGLIMAGGLFLNEALGAAGIINRWAIRIARVALITQVAQTGSRNAYLTFMIVLVAGTAMRSTHWKRALAVALIFSAAVVLLPVAALQAGLGKVYVPQLEPALKGRTWELSPRGQTLSLRSKLWRQAAAEISFDPWTGIGPNVFQESVGPRVMKHTGFNAHNLLLQIAVETGLIGLVLALAWAVVLVSRRTPHSAVLLPLAVLAVGQFLDCFVHDPPTMVIGAIYCGALLGVRPRQRPRPNEDDLQETTLSPLRKAPSCGYSPLSTAFPPDVFRRLSDQPGPAITMRGRSPAVRDPVPALTPNSAPPECLALGAHPVAVDHRR